MPLISLSNEWSFRDISESDEVLCEIGDVGAIVVLSSWEAVGCFRETASLDLQHLNMGDGSGGIDHTRRANGISDGELCRWFVSLCGCISDVAPCIIRGEVGANGNGRDF